MILEQITGEGIAEACDALVVAVDADGGLCAAAAALNERLGGWISQALQRGDLSGKRGEIALVPLSAAGDPGAAGPAALAVVGVGPRERVDRSAAFETAATATRRLSDRGRGRVVIALADFFAEADHDALVAGAVTGVSGQELHRTEPKLHPPETLVFAGIIPQALRRGEILGDSVNLTRRLVNEPPNRMDPETFVGEAQRVAAETGLEIEVWDRQRLKEERCEALLAVAAGSECEPRLLILRHRGGAADAPPLALVGKGVTFDSGGLSLKPSDSMADMKSDMAGAATVLGAIRAAALLEVPHNVVALCGLVENMISGGCYRVGDVITTRNGKTIEILNTDAEGRVVLADVLDVARGEHPGAVIDVATLTGACVVALGLDVAGLMTNDQSLCDAVRSAAEAEGEPAWQLPMFEEYAEQIRSKVADLRNTGQGRWGGAITAAKFLEEFVGEIPWVHIDIAGPAFAETAKGWRDAGATGAGVRTLVRLSASAWPSPAKT